MDEDGRKERGKCEILVVQIWEYRLRYKKSSREEELEQQFQKELESQRNELAFEGRVLSSRKRKTDGLLRLLNART